MTFPEVLDQLGIQYALHGQSQHVSANWLGIRCPYCDNGKGNFGLGYNLSGGYMACWGCGPKRSIQVLMDITGLPYPKIKTLVGDLTRGRLPEHIVKRGTLKLPVGLEPLLPQHKRYLKSRGFDPDQLEALWKVQGLGRTSSLAWRIFIPVVLRSELVSWTTRSISPETRYRYISADPGSEKYALKDLLYGSDYARSAVVVCEGPLDVWKIGPGAVCTFGTTVTSAQRAAIAKYPRRYLCFDQERKAKRLVERLAANLAMFDGETHIVHLDTGKDPGEASEREIAQIRRLLA